MFLIEISFILANNWFKATLCVDLTRIGRVDAYCRNAVGFCILDGGGISHLHKDLDLGSKNSRIIFIWQFSFKLVRWLVELCIVAWSCDLLLPYHLELFLCCLFFHFYHLGWLYFFQLGKALCPPNLCIIFFFNRLKTSQIHLHTICFKQNLWLIDKLSLSWNIIRKYLNKKIKGYSSNTPSYRLVKHITRNKSYSFAIKLLRHFII